MNYLAQQVPAVSVCHFSLDGTGRPRSRARTMDDRQYLYLPTQAVNGGSIYVRLSEQFAGLGARATILLVIVII